MNQKLVLRKMEFMHHLGDMAKLFEEKNRAYGDDFFSGNYSALERWMSIRRKVARLQSHYEKGNDITLPDETIEDTWRDLAIYCVMELMLLAREKDAKGGTGNEQERDSGKGN